MRKSQVPEIDPFTRGELQWGAMKVAVLGTFYDEPGDPGGGGIAFGGDGEAMHGNVVDDLLAFGQFVLPRNVIAMRASGEDLDLDVLREVLRHIAGMLLGAAVDVGAVPLNNDRDLHCRSSSDSGLCS